MALRDRLRSIPEMEIPAILEIQAPEPAATISKISTISTTPGAEVPALASPPRRASDREGGDIWLGMTRLWRHELAHPDFPEALQLALNNADAALASLAADSKGAA